VRSDQFIDRQAKTVRHAQMNADRCRVISGIAFGMLAHTRDSVAASSPPLLLSRGASHATKLTLGAPAQTSADLPAHYRVLFPHLDRLESACVVHGPRAAKMACVALCGFVVRITLDPRCAAGGSTRDRPVEQCRGYPMPSKRRGDDEARDPNHGSRLGAVGIDERHQLPSRRAPPR